MATAVLFGSTLERIAEHQSRSGAPAEARESLQSAGSAESPDAAQPLVPEPEPEDDGVPPCVAPFIVLDALYHLRDATVDDCHRPARASAVRELRAQCEQGTATSVGPEVWATLLKSFLRELAVPVIPSEQFSALVEADHANELGAAVERLLPAANHCTLCHMVAFMRSVAERTKDSAVAFDSLATMFVGCLLHSSDDVVTASSAAKEHALVLELLSTLELRRLELKNDRTAAAKLRSEQESRQELRQAAHPDLQQILEGAAASVYTLRDKAVEALNESQLPRLPFDLYDPTNRDSLPTDYQIEELDEHQKRALTAAIACVLTGRLNRLAPVPPPVLVANECELLRAALLTTQGLSAREAVFADAVAAGAALADELHKQRFTADAGGSSRLSVAELQRQASILAELEAQPRYTAVLRLSNMRAANVIPAGGWETGARPELCLVARALGPEVDPETALVATAPARVDVASGEVLFSGSGEDGDDGALILQLTAEPAVIQFEFAFAGADVADMSAPRLGKGTKALLWAPNPAQPRRATVQIELDLKTGDISGASKQAAVAGTHGKARLFGMAKHSIEATRAKAVQVSKSHELCIKNEELCIKNEEFCRCAAGLSSFSSPRTGAKKRSSRRFLSA